MNIIEVECEKCGATLEFFGDDEALDCPECGARVTHPSLGAKSAE